MARGVIQAEVPDPSLHLPRILCLHGGGTNSRIFRAQCRVIMAHLQYRFRFCFVEASLQTTQPGSDVVSVYKHAGPFKAWLPMPGTPSTHHHTVIEKLESSIEAAKAQDDRRGATGDWVALLGFSQGAKICASLLFRQQVRAQRRGAQSCGSEYRFGVLLAGRGPLMSLDPSRKDCLESGELPRSRGNKLQVRTIHVHGVKDPGLHLHRQLMNNWCEKGSTTLLEWEGDHRVPIKTLDVAAVASCMLRLAAETGVFEDAYEPLW